MPPKQAVPHPSPSHAPPILTAKLQNTLHTALITHSALPNIHRALAHELSAAGWTDNLRNYVVALLRSGECSTYGEVMDRVLRETGVSPSGPSTSGTDGPTSAAADSKPSSKKKDRDKDKDKDKGKANGLTANGLANGEDADAAEESGSIRVPERAIREGIRVVRRELEKAVDVKFEDEDKS